MLTQVVSGGQTGIDQLALAVAKMTAIPTGGWAAKGWITEDGPMEELLKSYGLKECPKAGYPARTRLNIQDSDGTVVFGELKSVGSALTVDLCDMMGKPCIVNPTPFMLLKFIGENNIQKLNVAGNRGSKLSNENRDSAETTMLSVFTYQHS
jgi:hypothetical protein